MNKRIVVPGELIIHKIYLIRGQKVMLDRDLAQLYGVQAIRLREQVKRNKVRFPDKFMFLLTEAEVDLMVSHFAIPSKKHLGGALPYAFTEHGILMLANVLRSEQAIQMSIQIIEIFVRFREMLLSHKDILLKLEQLERQVTQHSDEIQAISRALKQLINPPSPPRNGSVIKPVGRNKRHFINPTRSVLLQVSVLTETTYTARPPVINSSRKGTGKCI